MKGPGPKLKRRSIPGPPVVVETHEERRTASRTTGRGNKVSLHLGADDLDAVSRFAAGMRVSRGQAVKILFSRGLTSLRHSDPVLDAIEELAKDRERREWEQIALMVEAVIALRYLSDCSEEGISKKIREYTKEAVSNIKAKVELNRTIF